MTQHSPYSPTVNTYEAFDAVGKSLLPAAILGALITFLSLSYAPTTLIDIGAWVHDWIVTNASGPMDVLKNTESQRIEQWQNRPKSTLFLTSSVLAFGFSLLVIIGIHTLFDLNVSERLIIRIISATTAIAFSVFFLALFAHEIYHVLQIE